MANETGASEGAPAAGDSALARVPGVFFSPARTFEAIARRPTWLAPLLLWTAVSLLVAVVLVPRIDFERAIRQKIEKSGRTIPEEKIQSIVEQQKKIGGVLGYVGAGLAPLAICAIVGGVYWGAFKAFGKDLTFVQSFGVTAHGFLPGVVGAVLTLPVLARQEKVDPSGMGDLLRSNLGFLVDRDASPALYSLAQSVDLFSFWTAALLVVGYAASTKSSRTQSAGVVVTIWALYVLGKAGFAALLPH